MSTYFFFCIILKSERKNISKERKHSLILGRKEKKKRKNTRLLGGKFFSCTTRNAGSITNAHTRVQSVRILYYKNINKTITQPAPVLFLI